jgi:hypothetical protein
VREVTIPDDLFARLQSLAVPLVDTVPDVVRRLLDHYERTRPESNSPGPGTSVLPPSHMPTLFREPSLRGRARRERGATIEIDDHQIQAVSVRDMYEQAMRFMIDNGHSKPLKALVPFRTSGRRYLIADRPIHPNGNDFVVPARYGGFFMESHKDYRNAVEHLRQLTSKLGLKLRYLG